MQEIEKNPDNKNNIELNLCHLPHLEFDWHLTNRCNFGCEYCHPQIKKELNNIKEQEPSVELISKRFNDVEYPCLINMSGGEPFLYPNFVELCKELTKKHFLTINSNISTSNVIEFAEKIPSKKVVLINAAFHQPERSKINGEAKYIENILALQENGFNVTALYVLYPPLLTRVSEDIMFLKNNGVKSISAKVFKGVYKGKLYPEGYTENEKVKILSLINDYKFNEKYMRGEMYFTGQNCNSGYRFFKIEVDGKVYRCPTIHINSYGNFYDGTFERDSSPQPCTGKRVLVLSQCLHNLVQRDDNDD